MHGISTINIHKHNSCVSCVYYRILYYSYMTCTSTLTKNLGCSRSLLLKPGMFLFLVTQSHITADVLGKRVFGHHLDKMGTEDPVAESFETVPRSGYLIFGQKAKTWFLCTDLNLFCIPVGLCISGWCRTHLSCDDVLFRLSVPQTHSFGISSTKLEMNPMALRNQRLWMWNSQELSSFMLKWTPYQHPAKLRVIVCTRKVGPTWCGPGCEFCGKSPGFFSSKQSRGKLWNPIPIGSMYAIYGNMDPIFYHHYTPNVSIYSIHGSYGIWLRSIWWFSFSWQFFSFRHWWLRSRAADPSTNLELFGAVLVYMYNYVPSGKLIT